MYNLNSYSGYFLGISGCLATCLEMQYFLAATALQLLMYSSELLNLPNPRFPNGKMYVIVEADMLGDLREMRLLKEN